MDIQTFCTYFFKYLIQQSSGIKMEILFMSCISCAIVIHLISLCYSRIVGRKINKLRELLWIFIVCYFCFGSQVVFFQREAGSRTRIVANLDFGNMLGNYYSRQQFFYALLNVLFFVPWGFLWGLYKNDDFFVKRLIMVTCYSFLSSFVIEIMQLITQRGHFEMSDIVTNLLGGMLGCILASIVLCLSSFARETKRGS